MFFENTAKFKREQTLLPRSIFDVSLFSGLAMEIRDLIQNSCPTLLCEEILLLNCFSWDKRVVFPKILFSQKQRVVCLFGTEWKNTKQSFFVEGGWNYIFWAVEDKVQRQRTRDEEKETVNHAKSYKQLFSIHITPKLKLGNVKWKKGKDSFLINSPCYSCVFFGQSEIFPRFFFLV